MDERELNYASNVIIFIMIIIIIITLTLFINPILIYTIIYIYHKKEKILCKIEKYSCFFIQSNVIVVH